MTYGSILLDSLVPGFRPFNFVEIVKCVREDPWGQMEMYPCTHLETANNNDPSKKRANSPNSWGLG